MKLSKLLQVYATCLLLVLNSVVSQSYNDTTLLLTKLFTEYDKDVRPLLNQNQTINVTVSMRLRSIESINEKDQTIAIRTYIVILWKDDLLTWAPQDYGNIEVINPGVDRAWLPPFNMAGQISDNQALVDTSIVTPLRVRYDGSVSWFPNVRLVQTCNMDMTYFPNDEHNCTFELYVLMYSVDQVSIVLATPSPDLDLYIENGGWELLGTSWISSSYSVGNETFQVIDMSVKIKRRPRFFLMNLLFPTLALSFLNILVFVLPADSGEKVGYSITVLLSVMLIMGVTTDNMPASSQLPLITQFMAVLVAISVFSVMATVVSLFIHHKIDREKKEETKAVSVLQKWKSKLGKKFLKPSAPTQVFPAGPDTQGGGDDDKMDHDTKDHLRSPSVISSNTYPSTKIKDSRSSGNHELGTKILIPDSVDKKHELNIEYGESNCVENGGYTERNCPKSPETVGKEFGIGGLASLCIEENMAATLTQFPS